MSLFGFASRVVGLFLATVRAVRTLSSLKWMNGAANRRRARVRRSDVRVRPPRFRVERVECFFFQKITTYNDFERQTTTHVASRVLLVDELTHLINHPYSINTALLF